MLAKFAVNEQTMESNKERSKTNNSIPDVLVEEKFKCGEIFLTETGHISCYCLMCQQDYENFSAFSNHLLKDHLKLNNFNDVDDICNQNVGSAFTNNDLDNFKTEPCSKSSISNKFNAKETNFIVISNFDCSNEDNEKQYVTSSANSLESQKTNTEFNIEIKNVKKYICKICQQHFTNTEIFQKKKLNYSLDRKDFLYCQKCIQELPTFKENKIKHNTERQAHQPRNDVDVHLIQNYEDIRSREKEKKLKTNNDFKFYSLIKDKNRTVKGINYCELCSKNFISQKEYDEHILSFHGKNIAEKVIIIKPNKYIHCPKKFEKINLIKQGEPQKSHAKVEACDFCGKLFATKNSKYKQHLRCHTGEKPFVCSICSNTFTSRGNLNYHLSTSHSEERPYICTWQNCEKAFKIDRLRVLHERIHTGEKPYQCEQCGEHFAFQHKLSLHKKRKHLDKNDRPHKCDLCEKKFVLSRQLREHKYTHTGEKPNQCDICPAKFAKRSVLVEHKKLHTGEKKHVCGICGKAFAQRAGYSSHVKSHSHSFI